MFDGKGIQYYKGGDYYDGLWRNNVKHGQGKYVSGELVETQEWREGQMDLEDFKPSSIRRTPSYREKQN